MDGMTFKALAVLRGSLCRALLALLVLLAPLPIPVNGHHKTGMFNTSKRADEAYAPDRVLVTFKAVAFSAGDGVSDLGIRPFIRGEDQLDKDSRMKKRKLALRLLSKSSGGGAEARLPLQAFSITDGMTVEEKVAQLSRRGDVAIAEPDYKVQLYRKSSDPFLSSQWHHKAMRSMAAWDYTTGSSDVKVCVIDSGVSKNHTDLAKNILKGWNVAPDDTNRYPVPGSAEWSNYEDTMGHGTHVTGLVAAVGNNGDGVSGMAWKAGVLTCKFISDSGSGYVSDAITCMRLCQQEGAHIYSNSWGGVGYSETLLEEIKKLDAAGALFVVAAGNNNGLDLDSTPLYPASYKVPNILTVTSTSSNNELSSFSNIGNSTVHVAAPGSTIYSTTYDGGYGTMSGTSMAAPIVSGVASLLKSMVLKYNYDLSPAELSSILMESSAKFTNGNIYTISGGRVDALAAVRLLKGRIKSKMAKSNTKDGGSNYITPEARSTAPRQSSTRGAHIASNALSNNSTLCAITHPKRSYPWWTFEMSDSRVVKSVELSGSRLRGARIMVGDMPWLGSGSAKKFQTCGTLTSKRSKSAVIECPGEGITGKYVSVYLPRKRKSLTLCGLTVNQQPI